MHWPPKVPFSMTMSEASVCSLASSLEQVSIANSYLGYIWQRGEGFGKFNSTGSLP